MIGAALALPQNAAAADPSAQVPWGVRGLGMGGAFSALADDASSLFWNPAGLVGIDHQEVAATDSRLYGTPLTSRSLSAALPVSRRDAVALAWHRLGVSDTGLEYSFDTIALGYARRVHPRLQAGIAAKFARQSTSFDDISVEEGSGTGLGLDAGLGLDLSHGFKFAAVVQDAFDTRVETSTGSDHTILERNIRWSAGYQFRRLATLAFDLDDRWHVGTEVVPEEHVVLRTGMQGGNDEDGTTYAAGLGLRAGPLRVDYAYVMPPVLSPTHYWGLNVAFRFNPSLIDIVRVDAQELYASLYQSYAILDPADALRAPVTATLRNTSDRTLEATVRVEIPGIGAGEAAGPVPVPRGRAIKVPLALRLSERVLAGGANHHVPVRVTVTYNSLRVPRSESRQTSTFLFGPGAITWSRGMDQAAAFVTADDPMVRAFARDALAGLPPAARYDFGHPNIAQAAAVFDALSAAGVRYAQDPENPYERMSQGGRNDTVKYPRTTLLERGGDCDDTTILFAALLASLGIRSAFVDTPGHISLLLDTGLMANQQFALGLPAAKSVLRDGVVWVPVETTAIEASFAAAWEQGALNYQRAAGSGAVQCVDVVAAWKRYPPSLPPGTGAGAPAVDPATLRQKIESDLTEVARWRAAAAAPGSPRPAPAAAPMVQARVLFRAGRADAAREIVEKSLATHGETAQILNNRAAILAASGDLLEAAAILRRAESAEPADAGIAMNAALVSARLGDRAAALAALQRAAVVTEGKEAALRILGLERDALPAGALEPGNEATLVDVFAALEKTRLFTCLYWKD